MNRERSLPDTSNFFASLTRALSTAQIAALLGATGWSVRKAGWAEFEVRCAWGELIIEGDEPVLLHGPVQRVIENAEAILAPLRSAGIAYRAECYGDDHVLLGQHAWPLIDAIEPNGRRG
jgi:hypothetical protein